MNRKSVLGIAAMAVVAALAPGCSASPADGDGTTLTFAMWDESQRPTYEKMFDLFTQENPDIEVKIELTPWDNYWTKLQTAASGGEVADVFWINGANFPLYASEQVIQPLTGHTAADSSAPEGLIELYTWDSELYTLPSNFDTIAVWYNKDVFDAAGIDYPTPEWTWEDYRRIAAELTDSAAGIWGTAAQLSEHTAFYNTIYQAGGFAVGADGTTSGYDLPETENGLQFWVDLLEDGSSPTLAQMADTDVVDLFTSGKLATLWGGSWNSLSFSESELGAAGSIGVASLPYGPESNAAVIHGLGNVISATTEHADAANKLVAFLASQEAAEVYAENGVGFTVDDTANEALIATYADTFDLTPFSEAAATGIAFPRSVHSQVWMDAQINELTPVWELSETVHDGALALHEAVQAALDDE